MLAIKGMGQTPPFIDTSGIPEEGSAGYVPADPSFVDISGSGVNTPGTTMGGAGASGVLSVLNTVIADGAAVAKVALTPMARIAGPYGVSSIPVGGTVTPSGLMTNAGLSLGGISPILLLGGLALVVMMMASRGR